MRNLYTILLVAMLMACEQPVEIRERVKDVPVVVAPVDPPSVAPTPTPVAPDPATPAPDQPQAATPTPPKITVKNSLWQDIDVSSLVSRSRSAADPTPEEVQDAIDAYNAAHTDDMLRLYEGEAPDLDESPTADVYIVHPTTYHVNMSAIGIDRSLLVTNIDGWKKDAYGQKLFVDHVPPVPIIVETVGPYDRYAIYVVDENGKIQYETHCGYAPDGDWDGGPEMLANGWRDADHYYEVRRSMLWAEVVSHAGWRLIEHQLYTEPEVTP